MLRELLDEWWWVLAGLAFFAVILVATVVYPAWKSAVDKNRDARADPHHIAGNLYFVGAPDVTGWGGEVVVIPLTPGQSTTSIIQKLRAPGSSDR